MNTSNASLSKSEFAEKYDEILFPIESYIVQIYEQNPDLHDHDVLRAYEAVLKYIKAKLTRYPLPQPNLKGISLTIYEFILNFLNENESSYSFQEFQDCLKILEKSMKLWNREHGSRGYLNYIDQFI